MKEKVTMKEPVKTKEQSYEVLYIDKFTDMVEAALVNNKLRKTFKLNPRYVEKLSCGHPVVIKKKVGIQEAEHYKIAVQQAGGVAWIQELGPNGKHVERRQCQRRDFPDRRVVYRVSAIVPDRRENKKGRRSTDCTSMH